MDDLEPWNMFTNDYMPDDATDGAGDGDGDGDGDVGGEIDGDVDGDGNGGDESNQILEPLQDFQVKEEPEDNPEENFDEGAGDDAPIGFNSSHQNEKEHNNREGDDNALFDISEGGNSTSHSKPDSPDNQTSSIQSSSSRSGIPPDNYFNNMIKYEDAIIYICPACGEEFHSQEIWKFHLNSMHQFGTRRGLNFMQIDKLYHECQECHKRIAMHSMENLLKHKFTHLPYRCVKCDVCKRQYKYRQDLMIHLRMAHRDELINLAKENHKKNVRHSPPNSTIRSILNKPIINTTPDVARPPQITIGQVKENATDIYDHSDNIEVRNELINDEEEDEECSIPGPPKAKKAAIEIPLFFDDGSTSGSANDTTHKSVPRSKISEDIDESLEEYVLFLCPQCGSECETQSQWRQHIEFIHGYGTRKGLNMRDVNQGQAQCMECNQIINNNTLQNLQAHKFNHLPRKQWMNCKLCFKSFNDRKEVTKHLSNRHHLLPEPKTMDNNDDDSQEIFGFGGDDFDDSSGIVDPKHLLSDQESSISRREERDEFEQHIDYLCPQCGQEFSDKKVWRKHIVKVHNLGEIESMNFEVLNERQLKCKECDKIITNAYGIQNAQQHRITHMQYKSFAKCRICQKQYTDRKGLLKHLRGHGVGSKFGIMRFNESSPIPNIGSNSGSSLKGQGSTNMKSYRTAAYPQKEIVRHHNYTFEISFIDEGDDNSRGASGNAVPYDFSKGDAHLHRLSYQMPKHSSYEPMARHRCVDCGSSFPSPQVLQHHIRTEHDFVDFAKNSPKKIAQPQEDKSNDTEDLLVPSRTSDVRTIEGSSQSSECHFIYICPQCGIEFKERHLWRRHINDEHKFDKRESLNFKTIDKFRFQCNTCHEVVQSSKLKGLQDHKFRHCPYRQYLRCLICGQAYNHKPNMISHLRQRHNINYVEPSHVPSNIPKISSANISKFFNDFSPTRITKATESNASSSSSRPTGLKTVEDVISFHNAVDHESITYHCPSCNDSFASHVYWRKHIVEEHNLNSREGLHFRQLDDHHYICLQCYKRVTVTHTKGAIGQLQSHKFRHLPYKSFRCTVCIGEFVRKQMFFKHLDKKTNKCPGPPQDLIKAGEEAVNESQQKEDKTLTETSDNTLSAGKFGWSSRTSIPTQTANNTSEPPKENQECFTLCCPQCGVNFETTRAWREHINIEHSLNNRTVLNFKKLNPKLHVCLECNEHVNGRKLRDLQVHKFKHLPHGAYLNCRFCPMKYFHISNMQEHLKNKHPHMLHKSKNFDEDDTTILDDEDDEDSRNFAAGDYEEDDSVVREAGAAGPPNIDIDILEAEADIEEVDPDNVESDEQYLLG